MNFDLGDHLSPIYPPLQSEVISLSHHPPDRFSLCSSSSGLICSTASDYIFLLRPIIHNFSFKFQLFSQRLGNDQRLTTFKLVTYVSARRWKQRAMSEVELQSTQTIHQLGLNIHLGKFMIKENDISGKSFYLLSDFWSISGIDLVSVITSQHTLHVFNCNFDESGLVLDNFLHPLYFDPLKIMILKNEPCSHVLWTDSYKKMNEKINFVSIVSANWSKIFINDDGIPFMFLGCGMKNGRLLIWKIHHSSTSNFEDYELIYEKYFHSNSTWINMLSWSDNFTNTVYLALCSTDGTIDVIILNSHDNELVTYNLYNDKDGAVVKAILWEIEFNENNCNYIFLIKGSYLFMFSLTIEYLPVTYLKNDFICVNISHTSAVASLTKLFMRYIVVGYVDFTFAIYDNQKSYLKRLTRESNNFSKFINDYFVGLTISNMLMLSFTFSPNSLYVIIICVGSLIGCGRPSKYDISLMNKIIFIPIISIPIIHQSLHQPFISEFIHWDLTKLYLFDKTHQTCEKISSFLSSLPHAIKMKLEYIFNYINCSVDSLSTEVYLLIHFNSHILSIAGSNLIPHNEVHYCFLQYQQTLLNSNFEAVNLETCEACGSHLKFDYSKMFYICVNGHMSEFCVLTLKKISLAEESIHCILCKKKILKSAMKELSSLLPKQIISCPLCDGLLINS